MPADSPPVVPPPGGSLSDAIRKKARNSKRVAWLLDECIRIPGTKIRFGLDPILGLIPYGGEAASTLVGAVVLGEAGKRGIPFRTLVRMGGNMILNAGVGTIPVLGDLFSFWFKSNSRNHRMLVHYLESDEADEAPGGWWPLLVVGGTIFLVILLNVLSWVMLTAALAYLLGQLGF